MKSLKNWASNPQQKIKMPFILLVLRLFLGGVFVYAGWGKLMAPIENFVAVIEAYQFLKPPFTWLVGNIVPWLELIFGMFLTLGFLTRTSAASLTVFLLVFILLLLRSILLHLPISECGCFGAGITLAPWQALILDAGLLIISLIMIWSRPRLLSLDEKLHK